MCYTAVLLGALFDVLFAAPIAPSYSYQDFALLSRFPALFGAATHSCYAPCVRYTQQLLVHGQMGDGGASTLPTDNAGYLRAEYWDARFEHEAEYEWFRRCALQCA